MALSVHLSSIACLRPSATGLPSRTQPGQAASTRHLVIAQARQDGRQAQGEPGRVARELGKVALGALAALTVLQPAGEALAYLGGGPYGRQVTRGQDLSGRDFHGLDLTQQDFKASILRQANFKDAKLIGASFFDSDLTMADLTNADLRGADFSLANANQTNFTNANLEGAYVTGNTIFKNAVVTGADFTDVLLRDDQKATLCKVADGVNSVTGNATRETLLC